MFPVVLLDSNSSSTYSVTPGPKICQVTPLVTTVQTTYDTAGIISVIQPPLNQKPLPDPNNVNSTGMLVWIPALMIWTTFVRSQGHIANMIGDQFLHVDFELMDHNILVVRMDLDPPYFLTFTVIKSGKLSPWNDRISGLGMFLPPPLFIQFFI